MIELYLSISEAISKATGNKWVDIGPRVADHTAVYPATFVQNIDFTPEELGDGQFYGEFTFAVVTYIKPYRSGTANLAKRSHELANNPKSPVLSALAEAFEPVTAVRQAICNLQSDCVQNTVWLRETIACDRDGMYAVTQQWKATACVGM